MGLAFLAGADGMLQGGYLTIQGRDVSDDKKFIEELEKFYL
jgi:biotin synthase